MKLLAVIATLAVTFSLSQSAAPDVQYDLVIINGRVIDGTGNPWFNGSIAIRGDRIVKVGYGANLGERAARVIDAEGMVIAPGFIDVHTHVEGNIGENPTAENFLRMGVTSIVTGNCGRSESDVSSFLAGLQSRGISINVATLIGHGSVRREVMGLENREPTSEELGKMREMVERAMRDGAVGLSTGLIYVPGTYARTDEIVDLAKVVARFGGVYASHMRDEGNLVTESIKEALTIGEKAQIPVNVSHFKVSSKRRWGASRTTCKMVADARARGQQVTVDQYVYTASSTSLDTLLPSWALEGGREAAITRLKDSGIRAKIGREMLQSLRASGFRDFSYAVVSRFVGDPSFEGKNIAEITRLVRGAASIPLQIEQILAIYEAGSASMVYHKMAELDVERIVRQPFTMIASDSGILRMGRGVPHPRGYGNNARVLAQYVRDKKLLSLEDAIRKMTSLPAATFRLWDRGLIRPGMAADVVIFDPAKVRDRATFDKPHQYAEGFMYIVVNGKPVIDRGVHDGSTPGHRLYGPGK